MRLSKAEWHGKVLLARVPPEAYNPFALMAVYGKPSMFSQPRVCNAKLLRGKRGSALKFLWQTKPYPPSHTASQTGVQTACPLCNPHPAASLSARAERQPGLPRPCSQFPFFSWGKPVPGPPLAAETPAAAIPAAAASGTAGSHTPRGIPAGSFSDAAEASLRLRVLFSRDGLLHVRGNEL